MGHDGGGSLQRFVHRGALIALVERFRDAEREPHFIETRRNKAVEPTLVEREPRVDDSLRALQSGDDFLGAGHLGHPPWIDEARYFHGPYSGTDKAPHELCSNGRLEDVGLVLETVAGADFIDSHARARLHAATLAWSM